MTKVVAIMGSPHKGNSLDVTQRIEASLAEIAQRRSISQGALAQNRRFNRSPCLDLGAVPEGSVLGQS